MEPSDAAQFLVGSGDRTRLLDRLREDPGSPSDLADALDVSRRSVQRNCAALVERGWAEKRDGAYRLTTEGELVAERHRSYLADLDRVEALAPLYRHLPDRDHAPDPELAADATLVTAGADDPQAPVHHYVAALRGLDVDRVRMLSPVLSRLFHDVHAELALEGAHTELVLPDALVERARAENPTEFDVVVSVGVLDLYRHPGEAEVGLTIAGDRVLLGAYDADGQLRALLDGDDPALREWAVALFEAYRERADPVDPPFPPSFPFGNDR